MFRFLSDVFDVNKREIARFASVVEKVNALEEEIKKLKDKNLLSESEKLQEKIKKGSSLTDILPRAFALVREASRRVNNERPFDVQVMGGIALHEGKIAEQKTGEGKTLTASMPLYLNALTKRGVHLVTVNDYLAKVGAGWMGPIYKILGLSCSAIIHDLSFIYDPEYTDENSQDWRLAHLRPVSRKEAYDADIAYGVNSEFGFDYLRDNMSQRVGDLVQRDFYFAIVDEVDSVLIDEARTPHIISSAREESTEDYYQYAKIGEKLVNKLDYVVDEKTRSAHLTDHGIGKIEQLLGVKDIYEKSFQTVHHIEAALKAKVLYFRDKDYVVKDNEVIIVDEFTGRLKPGQRWAEGIHQAVEAKENVPIQQESKTMATISLQNYFRKYEKLSGMTGTAVTEAEEFFKIYKLPVISLPTHRNVARTDHPDQIYKTQRAKYAAVVADVERCYKMGQPVLVGTTSIEKNEIIDQFLHHKNIPHQVLNAKQHEKEAMTLSQAGRKGAVTVATNMAGRGVDIILGGTPPKHDDGRSMIGTPEWKKWEKEHEEVVSLGGLHVIGTERHESRRIDNQLRGRAGRQGDPGSSRFYVALDDDLMRIFGGDQVAKLMTMFNIPENQPLEHPLVSRSIEQAQKKVEGLNFDSRKQVVEYDDIMNKQRDIVYSLRRKILMGKTEIPLRELILEKISVAISSLVIVNSGSLEGINYEKIVEEYSTIIPFDELSRKSLLDNISPLTSVEIITQTLNKIAQDIYQKREKDYGQEVSLELEKWSFLSVIDTLWMDHLDTMTDLREGVGLRGYAQRDPLTEYKSEAFSMFEKLISNIDDEIAHRIFKVQVSIPQEQRKIVNLEPRTQNLATNDKLGRNDPCWCGSGKKWKKCHYPQTK